MPRLKPSKGLVQFKTVFPEEFQRYLCYELANIAQWNKDLVKLRTWLRGWQATGPKWEITWDGIEVSVRSEEPVVHLRKGLEIRMGDGILIIAGHTP